MSNSTPPPQILVADDQPDVREALRLMPEWTDAMNDLAQLLATNPDAAVRNGAEALQLAQQANELHRRRHPQYLATLAAAQAEVGQFDQAARTAQNAIDAAKAAGNDQLVQAVQQQLKAYNERRPDWQLWSGTVPGWLTG